VNRSARLLGVAIEEGAAEEIARRCRGTPRIANRLLRRRPRLRAGARRRRITQPVAQTRSTCWTWTLRPGRDRPEDHADHPREIPRRAGGREYDCGLDLRGAGHHREVYEPYLIQLGFLNRTPRGRTATELAFDYFNVKAKLRKDDQPALF